MLLKGDTSQAGARSTTRQLEEAESQGGLVCAYCRGLVTSRALAISINGSHAHSFVNPHGFTFRIGCFADAAGCAERGEESNYWTWFPGFSWRISLCRHCSEHLGWSFRSADARFFGLILERLREAD